MKRLILAVLLLAQEKNNTPPDGFAALFNGKDLSGWKADDEAKKHWAVKNGLIDYDGKNKDLWTEKEYGDIELRADWRWSKKPVKMKRPIIHEDGSEGEQIEVDDAGDSGIYLRGSSKSQVNIWCWPCGSGEVYGYRTDPKMPAEVKRAVTPKKNADKPIGEWNHFVITMKGDRLTVVLNGEEVISNAQLPGVAAKGPIALQHHGDPIQFKNLYVKELK